MRTCSLFLIVIIIVLLPSTLFAQIDIMRFQDVKTGMKGIGKTVFNGTTVEEFQVEILGKLENIGPKQNIIIAKLSGGPLSQTGVLSGMSGSPVYINGKLVGATAFMWGFSKEPIAGITPIEEMLSIEEESSQGAKRSETLSPAPLKDISLLFFPEKLKAFFNNPFPSQAASGKLPVNLTPIGLPLIASGFSNDYFSEFRTAFAGTLVTPVQGAGYSENKTEVRPKLEPGSAVAVQLVKGDINISAVGTVTAIDGDKVLAFGHPFFNIGKIDMPMSIAKVETLLPSLSASFKIAVPLAEVGTFTEDRNTGVLGRLGQRSKTIPVRIALSNGKNPMSYSFDIIDNKLLTPVLLFTALNGILSSAEKDYGDATVTFKEGSLIKLSDGKSVDLTNLYSGDYTKFISTGTVAYILYMIMDNEYSESKVEGVNLLVDYLDSKKQARIEKVWCDRSTIRPGDKINITVSLKPYRGKEITEVREIEVPEEVPPGKLILEVGDAYMLSRMEAEEDMFIPRDFDHLIWLLNNLRTNDKIYLLFSKEDTGVLMEGVRFPNLPLSKSSVIIRPQTKGNYLVMDKRVVMEESIEAEYAIEGLKKIILEVEEK